MVAQHAVAQDLDEKEPGAFSRFCGCNIRTLTEQVKVVIALLNTQVRKGPETAQKIIWFDGREGQALNQLE